MGLSPDGRRMVTVGPDATANIRDASSGAAVRTITVEGKVSSVAFGPDDRIAVADASTVKNLGSGLRPSAVFFQELERCDSERGLQSGQDSDRDGA